MDRYTTQDVIEICGREFVDTVIYKEGAEPTGRLFNPAYEPAEHLGKYEYAVCSSNGKFLLIGFWYLTAEEEETPESYDWEKNAEWEVIEED